MATMGSMDINSTCDDGKVLLYLKTYQVKFDYNIIKNTNIIS